MPKIVTFETNISLFIDSVVKSIHTKHAGLNIMYKSLIRNIFSVELVMSKIAL